MFYNRDLSWLDFNYRVLQEANDPTVPLYERLKFLSIFSSNLDEFFRVRYPAVMAFSKLNKKFLKKEALQEEVAVSKKVQQLIIQQQNEFGQILHDQLLPALLENKIHLYYNESINPSHIADVNEIFVSKVLSFIQPVFLTAESSYNFLPENNQIYLLITLAEINKEFIRRVAIKIPTESLERFFVLKELNAVKQVIFLDDIIKENLHMLFPGQEIKSVFSIKFNRDAELVLDESYSDKLLDKIEKQLHKRDVGPTSRFLFEKGMPSNLQFFLSSLFGIEVSDMFEGGTYHNLKDLMSFPSFDESLHFPKQPALNYPVFVAGGDIFKTVLEKDILLHLPYHSYIPVLSFFNQAAVDPQVTEIYITLYRVASDSHIVNALISAAKNGKKVTAFIELKARFDEANNIKWSRSMKDAGVKLIYSDPDIKVHSKIALVKRDNLGQNQCFAVLSTGNFNEMTAKFYTDHVMLTSREEVCNEMMQLFGLLQLKPKKFTKTDADFKELYVTKFNMVSEFTRLIEKEMKRASKGLPALIRIKVNNLEEPEFINLLYKASNAGVKIHLIVRSICCLIPGQAGLSENITVRRIVDRFLEHPRIFIFGTDDKAVISFGSSDLMTRNLKRRIEVCLQIRDERSRKEILDYFAIQWADNTKAVQFNNKMEQIRLQPEGRAVNAQHDIYLYLQKAIS